MNELMMAVIEKFNGVAVSETTVCFTFGDDAYTLTDGTLYAVTDDGDLLPGSKKVRSLLAVENFVAARA